MLGWYHHLDPVLQEVLNALGRALLFLVPILMLVPGCIWWERRLLSWMQDRIGPNRVGNITWSKTSRLVPGFLRGKKTHLRGLLQPIADGVKLFFKEDITPASIDRITYFFAPAVALFPAFTLGGVLPWGPNRNLTPVADANVGVLYMLAISSLGVYGVVLAGYASNNKYSLMGGLRASAQLISYELAMGMSLACIVLANGSLRLTDMIKAQMEPIYGIAGAPIQNWFIFTPFGFVSACIFLVCMVAETNRAPFDLPEAENELIAGYHTEYSSMKFAVFFMGEYAAMFVFSGVFATVFLGGWNPLPIRWSPEAQHFIETFALGLIPPLVFIGKCFLGLTLYIWMRATLPRLRYDQLMSLGWKSLLPLATGNFIVVALWILITKTQGPLWGWVVSLSALVLVVGLYSAILRVGRKTRRELEERNIRLVDPSPRTVSLIASEPEATG
ncbi:MAG TPA: complex I subunit 1 family protein [Fimbriimonadaceae bacterium]|nr:complex I subunit 1 family protein [Fimbriimonadaceae bacterium]